MRGTGIVRVRVTFRLTVSQSGSSWCRAPTGAHDQIFIPVRKLLSCLYGAPSLTRGRVCHLSGSVRSLSVFTHYLQITNYQLEYVQYVQSLCQSRFSTADYALLLLATATTAVSHLNGRMLDRRQV
jgi:hypothetical protein